MAVFSSRIEETKEPPPIIIPQRSITIGPLRFYEPYEFTFTTIAKGRWYNRKLIEVFTDEFKMSTNEEILKKIENHKIVVNGKPIPSDYVIKEHDKIAHTTLRIESPVLNIPIEKIDENENYIAFLKPSSIPIHATGGYFYNSMVKQIDSRFRPLHRLDRVTSGIVVMGKNETAARNFTKMLDEKQISKTYIARVWGKFPEGETICDAPIIESSESRVKRTCGEGGKESKTLFKLLKTNGTESIVECHPITGRTHQIRAHLAYLGYPISNDTYYGGKANTIPDDILNALKEAKTRGLIAPEVQKEWDNHELTFMIYLRSVHYKSNLFDFTGPMPDWADI